MSTTFHSFGGKRKAIASFSRGPGVPGADNDYANAGKKARGGNFTSSGSSIMAQTRNPVTTPQCLVNLTSLVPKNEKQLRALAAKGDSSDLYGAPASNEQVFGIRKGMIVLHVAAPGGSFKTNIAADSNIRCIGSMNGVSMNTELFGCAVAQVDTSPADKHSNNQTATVWHGVQTVVNYSDQRWNAGDFLIADPFPVMVKTQSGASRSVVFGPNGIPEEQMCIILRPMGGVHLSNYMRGVENAIRLQFGTDANMAALVAAKGTPAGILKHIHTMCDKVFTQEIIVSPMHPIRGYAVLWAANRFYDMIKIDRASILSKGTNAAMDMKDFGNLLRVGMMVKLLACMDVEDKFAGMANGYATSLPHSAAHEDALPTNERARSSLHSKHLEYLLTPDSTITAEQSSARSLEADGRISCHVYDALSQYHHRIRAYFGQFAAGVCLSSADKGMSADVFFGKPQ